jgi:hypothetical protein
MSANALMDSELARGCVALFEKYVIAFLFHRFNSVLPFRKQAELMPRLEEAAIVIDVESLRKVCIIFLMITFRSNRVDKKYERL